MPYVLRYLPNKTKRCYSVREKKKKGTKKQKIYAKCTTKTKAKKQIRLLNAIKFNKKFRETFRRK